MSENQGLNWSTKIHLLNPEKSFNVRMNGWMDGDKKCPFIYMIFKYDIKPDTPFSKMLSKVACKIFSGLENLARG